MRIETFQCDICKTQKKDANYWWRACRLPDAEAVVLMKWEADPQLEVSQQSEAHLCGPDCIYQWLSKNLLTR